MIDDKRNNTIDHDENVDFIDASDEEMFPATQMLNFSRYQLGVSKRREKVTAMASKQEVTRIFFCIERKESLV